MLGVSGDRARDLLNTGLSIVKAINTTEDDEEASGVIEPIDASGYRAWWHPRNCLGTTASSFGA